MLFDTASLDSIASATTVALLSVEKWFVWENLKSFGNSAFTTSLVGALAGAYFGARSAQRGRLSNAAELHVGPSG